MRGGAVQGPAGRRDARKGGRSGRAGRWGALQGGLGVCVIVAGAAIGAAATVVTHAVPGSLLGLSVVAGTVAAALAVRPRDGWMILPVPALSYLVAALISGVVSERPADSSRTALAIAAAQWVADGFFAMALATALAAAITTVRWFLWRRRRPARRSPDWPVPASDAARGGTARTGTPPGGTGRRPRGTWDASAESGYPAGFAGTGSPRDGGETGTTRGWGDAGSGGPGPRPGPRPGAGGSGPYNFSSGA
jgi:Domain of unknown function (DUF6542)